MIRKVYQSPAGGRSPGVPQLSVIGRLPSPIIYLVAVVATKGMSLVTLPIMAVYLPPTAYGQYDVAVSFVEFILLILGLAIGPTLIRFASTATTDADKRRCARELLGTLLGLVVVAGAPAVIFGPYLLDSLGIETEHTAMRVLIAGSTVAAIVELPLVWLRLKDKAMVFFAVVMARTLAQALLMWLALSHGYGVAGLMITNGSVLIALAVVLALMQIRDTGISVSHRALMQIIGFGVPIVGADLALFGLGNANRLFMPGHVPSDVIAHFGLAMRFALVMSLATSPFDLWWMPKRIAILQKPGGFEESARMWSIALAIVVLAGAAVALGGPIIVHVVLPASYVGINDYLAPLVAIQSLHILTIFTNVGSYARANGGYVFAIEVTSALIAVAGYLILIPMMGVYGAIVSMAAGQVVRFMLHLRFGYELAPLPYPWMSAVIITAATVVLVAIAPPHEWLGWRFLYSGVVLFILLFLIVATGLVKMPDEIWQRLRARVGYQ